MEVLTIMQVQIKFTTAGCSVITGNFAPGDLLRTSPEMARHLVEEAKCAEYTTTPQGQATTQPKAAAKPSKRAAAAAPDTTTNDAAEPAEGSAP